MFKVSRALLIASVALCVYSACLIGSMVGGMGIAAVVICGIILASKRRRVLTAFGTARWAGRADLREAGMLDGPGLSIGRLLSTERPSFVRAALGLINPAVESSEASNRFLRALLPNGKTTPPEVRLSRSVHTAIFAPTGVGKGVSFVIPFLLACMASLVVMDFKGELAMATMDRRRRMGHRVVLLDPWHLVTDTPDTFNLLDFIKKDSPYGFDVIRAIAEALVISNERQADRHWDDSSKTKIVSAIGAVVQYGDPDDKSMQTVRNIVADRERMMQVDKLNQSSKAWDGMLARIGWQGSLYQDKEAASVMTTANRHLNFLDTPAVAASTRSSTFDPAELRTGKMTIYLVIPLQHARTQSGLLRMWIGSLMNAVMQEGLQQ